MHLFFLFIPLLYIAFNGYLFYRIWQAMQGLPTTIKITLSTLYWAITLSMFVAIILRGSELPAYFGKGLFRIGSSWLFFSCTAAMLLIALDIARIFIPAMQGNLWWAMGVAAAIYAYGNYNYRTPQAVFLDIEIEKPMKGELKIAAMSDLHLGYGTGKREMKKYVELINSHEPDVILIAGDLIDNSIAAVENENLKEEINKLKAPQGIYMAPGNHEYISGIEECKKFIAGTNIKLCMDSVVTLPCGVQLVLRDDGYNRKRLKLKQLFEKTDSNKPIILIDHKPNELAKSNEAGTDLHISGHTHNGQVWPGNLITDHIFEQSHGYRKWSHAHVWVSSGISLWGPPVRIGTKGDYAIITLSGREE